MVFVNEVADIVHGVCHRYLGAPNKNIGDAFLLVWKPFERDVETINGDVHVKNTTSVQDMADMACISFVQIIAAINKSKKLAKYRGYQALNDRMPNYRVKLGSGIHAGWAIEGAIGSEYKIDATYLSPHVNLTMELEEATKIYGVQFVMSHFYHDLASKELQDCMRPLDRVIVHGFPEVLTIYTFDIDINVLEVEKTQDKEIDKREQILQRIRARKLRDNMHTTTFSGKYHVRDRLKTNKDIVAMHKSYTKVEEGG